MTPILVRPVREQLEHERIIRLLHARFRRRHEVAVNAGDERIAPVQCDGVTLFPDLVLMSPERGRRLQGVVEVETGESVNHLEAMAQWAHLGRVRGAAFYLFVPASAVDVARRLCSEHQVAVAEIWSYHAVGDQVRFTMVHREAAAAARTGARRARAARAAAPRKTTGRSAAARPKRSAPARPVRKTRTQKRK